MTLPPIQAWLEQVCAEWGIPADDVPVREVLDATRAVAHGVDRPAAPVTAFAIGLAVGRAGGSTEQVQQAWVRVGALADHWETS